MPRIYRSMFAEGGMPKVGSVSKCLGVRTPPDAHADVEVDTAGYVEPGKGGMSVAPHWRRLPYFLIPGRLMDKGAAESSVRGASGNNSLICWRMSDGDFSAGLVADQLALRPDSGEQPKHGVVEPSQPMLLAEYQDALSATRDQWVRDED